ncbi:MAG: hypothetical protein C0415_01385 [Thermodesulfovibrio sp.]|nr:hypothetical protein [Thermodesulfovibrio sp.]
MPEIIADNISVINSAALEGASRLEAEYYQPRYLIFMDELSKYSVTKKTLLHLCEKIDVGFVGPMAHAYTTNGIPILQTQNVKEFVIDFTMLTYIQEWFHHVLQKSQVFSGDILIARSGSIGSAALVGEKTIKELNSSDIIIIRPKPSINKYYLCAYLNSKFGQAQIERFSSGGLQGHINISSLETLLVPLPDNKVQSLIGETVSRGMNLVTKATNLYAQAESRLLSELGIKDIDLSHDPGCEVNSADTILANRIDAEYYQLKYEKIIKKIKKYPYKAIGDMFRLIKGIEPGSSVYCEEGKPFIRVSNLNKFEINNNNQQYLSEETYSALESQYQPLKGEILLSKDATPGMAYHLKEQIEGIISGGILRLQALLDINKEYICLVVNSLIGQAQIERDSGGSVINHWKPAQVKNTLIPLLSDKIQNEIEALCLESFSARRRAKELLKEAKLKVEEMIEKGAA